jgi:Na+/H+-translocating membrane pyrophosphatase
MEAMGKRGGPGDGWAEGEGKSAVDEQGKRAKNPFHGAATSDTVGGPLEALAGPSLHALIKLLVTVTVVLAPLFL